MEVCANYKSCLEEAGVSIRDQEQGMRPLQSQEIKKMIQSGGLALCHITSIFPEKGRILPRMKFHLDNHPQIDPRIPPIVKSCFSVLRPTVHFGINGGAKPHAQLNFNSESFAIIDPLRDEIAGGYLEDLFCVGSYQLRHRVCS